MNADTGVKPVLFVVTVNGPGEISSWLYPFASQVKRRHPAAKIFAVVLPCVFNSGSEIDVLAAMDSIDGSSAKRESLRWIFFGRRPDELPAGIPAKVIHFGGEPLLSKLLSLRLRAPLFFYGERVPVPRFWYRKVYTIGDPEPNVSSSRTPRAIGNLMVDAVHLHCKRDQLPLSGSTTRIALYPGSRNYQAKHLLPFWMKVAAEASPHLGEVEWMIVRSDYMPIEKLIEFATDEGGRRLQGENARFVSDESHDYFLSDSGLRFPVISSRKALRCADLALTIPGTNTAELAISGIPMIVILPTQNKSVYPMPGPAGYLNYLPLGGKSIKVLLLWLSWKRARFLALPNLKVKRELVPEISGKVTPRDLARTFRKYIKSPLMEVSKELKEVMGPPGAVDLLLDDLLDTGPDGNG